MKKTDIEKLIRDEMMKVIGTLSKEEAISGIKVSDDAIRHEINKSNIMLLCNQLSKCDQSNMAMYQLSYFKKSNNTNGISGSDFENKDSIDSISLSHVSSISVPKIFSLPFSGKSVGKFAVVSMSNSTHYFIREKEHIKLTRIIELIDI